MSKLFKLKEWLNLEETAKHLTTVLGEDVTVADIYRLALDGHLVLSMYFPNQAEGNLGEVVGLDRAERMPEELALLHSVSPGDNLTPPAIIISPCIGDGQFINWQNNVIFIDGVWDLPMLAGEKLDVEHEFLQLSGGPSMECINIDGAFLRQGDVFARIMESTEENSYVAGSLAHKRELEAKILVNSTSEEAVKKIWETFAEDRKQFLKDKLAPNSSNYYPAGGLPKDGVYVVRTAAIVDFLNRINETPIIEKPLSTKERNSLLTLIAALCKEAKYDVNKRGIASSLAKATEELGKPLTDDTIRKILNQVKDLLG